MISKFRTETNKEPYSMTFMLHKVHRIKGVHDRFTCRYGLL